MAVNIFFLLGGMTIFVSAILYSVITRMLSIPETPPRRRRLYRRTRSRWYEVWFNAAAAPIVSCFLFLRGTVCAAVATLYSWITKIWRAPDDLQQDRRSSANANGCQHCQAQPLSTPRTSTRSQRLTRASHRATTGRREPPPTPVSSSESSAHTSIRLLRSSRLSTSEQAPPPSPTPFSGNNSPAPTRSFDSTGASSNVTRPQSPPSSPGLSSGGSTLIGTPSRAPSIATQNNTTQATQRRGRPTRLCEIKAFIASSLDPASGGDPAVAAAFNRLKTYMETNLNIAPSTCRLAALLSLIYGLHFAIAPERSLPIPNPDQSRYISARELACVFLNRYGPIVWPAKPEPAPHLTSRALQFPRDATIQEERHAKWHELLVKPPARGSAGDLAMSVLGERMTAFVRLVYQLPVTMEAEPDWEAVALVLDDTRPGQQGILIDEAEWSEALMRSAPIQRH